MERDISQDRQEGFWQQGGFEQIDWQEIVDEAHRRRRERKLTMRRLAAQANVSLPTVLRFEKNVRDIQLSSALAILDVLGMVAHKIEGTVLIKGSPDRADAGPYEVMFAPSAGAGIPLQPRAAEDAAALEALLTELGIDTDAQRRAAADIVRTGRSSIPGIQLSPRKARELWPEQFSHPIGELPRP